VVREGVVVRTGTGWPGGTLTEVARFGVAALESGGDGERSGGPTLLISVR